MTPSPESIKAAEALVEQLLTNGAGKKARRIRLVDADELDLGGWGQAAMVDRISRVIDAARREEREKSKLDPVIAAEWGQLQKLLADVPGDFLLHKVESLRAIEREACAKVADNRSQVHLRMSAITKNIQSDRQLDKKDVADSIAAAIRARGEVQP